MELNKIYNENCLDTMARMPDNFVDLVVTSPPYDNLRDYKGYTFDFESIAKELYRITATGGVVVWVVGDSTDNGTESGTSFRQALYFKEMGFNLHDTMIYFKGSSPYPGNTRYNQTFEYMFVFSKGSPKSFHAIQQQKLTFNSKKKKSGTYRQIDGSLGKPDAKAIERFEKADRVETKDADNVWYILSGIGKGTQDKSAFEHPATFPEELASKHIYSWSKENDLVYDPFMGSGTTAKMAKLLKRNYIGSEISEDYCKIAQERLDKTTPPML